ncbi:Hypothetical protein FKW44_018502 [Caligus rogercresseyi]|uniref:Uncharacterized protein n=1 Tax=Caligus rogercresseyi TaxID=217165 RepID=A0A7T8GUG9_CALRO|nr:Hypothetical protein FKW44_018502 [Caligus rogercresseyi]
MYSSLRLPVESSLSEEKTWTVDPVRKGRTTAYICLQGPKWPSCQWCWRHTHVL